MLELGCMRLYPCDERDCYHQIGIYRIFKKGDLLYSEMVLYHPLSLMGLEVEETEVGDPSECDCCISAPVSSEHCQFVQEIY